MGSLFKTSLALLFVVGVWWSMIALALSFEVIQASVGSATAPLRPGLELIWFDYSECCQNFNDGLAASLGLTALGGIPMALIAIAISMARRRLPRAEALQAALRAALIVQGGSAAANLFLAIRFWSDDLAPKELYPWGWLVVAGVAASLAAVPVWHRLSRSTAPQITTR